jgi:TRAP-type C4-dicarboxylate transport system permease small subunit
MNQTRLQVLKERMDTILGGIVAVVMAVLVIDVLWQVFTRFILRDPSSFTEELARYLMIWVGLLGAAYAAGKRMHLAVDLLPSKLSGRRKHYLGLIIEGFALIFAVLVLVIGGVRLVWVMLQLGQTSPALQIPLGYVYLAVPVSGLFMTMYTLFFIEEHVRALREHTT